MRWGSSKNKGEDGPPEPGREALAVRNLCTRYCKEDRRPRKHKDLQLYKKPTNPAPERASFSKMDMFPLTWIFLALYFSVLEVRGQAGKPLEVFFYSFQHAFPLKVTAHAGGGGHTEWHRKEASSVLNNLKRDPSRPSLPYTTTAAKTQLYSPARSVCVCVFWNIDRIWRCSDVTYGLNQRFKNTTKPFCITVFGEFFSLSWSRAHLPWVSLT